MECDPNAGMIVARYGLRVVACPAHLIAELEKEREQGRRTRGQGHGVTAGRRGADQGQRPTDRNGRTAHEFTKC